MKKLIINRTSGKEKPSARTIEIPVHHLKAIPGLIPRTVVRELQQEQIALEELISAADVNDLTGVLLVLTNHDNQSRIAFSVEK